MQGQELSQATNNQMLGLHCSEFRSGLQLSAAFLDFKMLQRT